MPCSQPKAPHPGSPTSMSTSGKNRGGTARPGGGPADSPCWTGSWASPPASPTSWRTAGANRSCCWRGCRQSAICKEPGSCSFSALRQPPCPSCALCRPRMCLNATLAFGTLAGLLRPSKNAAGWFLPLRRLQRLMQAAVDSAALCRWWSLGCARGSWLCLRPMRGPRAPSGWSGRQPAFAVNLARQSET